METLRERETTLLRANPDSMAQNGRNGHARNNPAQPVPAQSVAKSFSAAAPSVPTMSMVSEIDRFTRMYHDPRVPIKPVPYATLKRLFDILIALAVLIIAAPIMVVVAFLVKFTSRGPIIFRQTRVGVGGRYFTCYKFRSMCVDAEAKKQQLMHMNEANGPVFKIKRDPRITPVGAVIRKFSIDELPQLFNVLKGDMSLVGPRPPLPSEVELYTEHQFGRLAVRPGLTCLWQISGRSNISFERWVELDLLYIDTMSFRRDLEILVRTIPAVMMGSGAH